MRQSQRGFTLIELAIVLVIIGIILGAILKGQELIKNAQAKRLLNDLRGLEAAIWTFYDRYGRFPGDCDRNGRIDAQVYYVAATTLIDNNPAVGFCTTATTDRDMPWAELKAATILDNVDNRRLSLTPFNGRFFIGYANAGRQLNTIAVADVPCFVAKMIDTAIDGDTDPGIGRVRTFDPANSVTIRTTSDPNWGSYCTSETDNVDIVYLFDRQP